MDRLQRLSKHFLTLLIILIMGMISVSAAVYAEYTPSQSLYFKRPPPPFTSDTMFGTKLGQFKIWSDDGNIYTPVVTVTPDAYSTAIKMTGPYSWTPPNNYKTDKNLRFNVIFLAYRQGAIRQVGIFRNRGPIQGWRWRVILQMCKAPVISRFLWIYIFEFQYPWWNSWVSHSW